jgi:hypothetical protein
MYQNSSSTNPMVLKEALIAFVNEAGLSSTLMMCEQLAVPQETVIILLKELLDENKISGYLSEDESRFFKSSEKNPETPVHIAPRDTPAIVQADRGVLAYVPVIGIITFIAGQVLNQTSLPSNITEGIVMGGLLITVLGLIYITMIDSQYKKKGKARRKWI